MTPRPNTGTSSTWCVPWSFRFSRICVRIGELALRDSIELAVIHNSTVLAELELRRNQIIPGNGSILLVDDVQAS